MILVFNKTDVKDAEFAKEWMTDFEAFQAALREEEEAGSFGGLEGGAGNLGGGSGYMGSLLNSMSLVLEEFYNNLSVVGVSAMTGDGIEEFFEAVNEKAQEFERDYKPELERRRKQRQDEKTQHREKELGKLMKDMAVSESTESRGKEGPAGPDDMDTISDLDDESDGEDMDDGEENEAGGLNDRYQKALEASGGSQVASGDDNSFTRYIRASQMGM